jgi:diadenosine tetraphosphate (Ap4A) HIT family hydrolase/uncharacterized damage-inducible protein DinB
VTAIHRFVDEARAGTLGRVVARLPSGWAVLGDPQILPGYCLLYPDPVVAQLNSLTGEARRRFLDDMARIGDAVLRVTGAQRINYEILGNVEPALHAHVIPRYADEPQATRATPVWLHDWSAAPAFDAVTHHPLAARLAAALEETSTMTALPLLLERVILRDLSAVVREIEAYPDDASLWAQPAGVPNSAGTLALHLAGNLQHYLGHYLGGSDYVRDRPAEFARRDVAKADVLAELARAEAAVRLGLRATKASVVAEPFAVPFRSATLVTEDALTHLASHLAYHLGQIDYHRRVVTGQTHGIGAVDADVLARPA